MSKQVMITCAVTGSGDTAGKHPNLPVTPKQIAQACLDAAKAGAAIVHVHVRDPKNGSPSMDLHLYKEVVDRIRDSETDVVINLTTGMGARYLPSDANPQHGGFGSTLTTPEVRVAHVLELRPEICSLDMGSMNFSEHVFVNTPPHIRAMAQAIRAAGVLPELEVFDVGHLRLAADMIAKGELEAPGLFQIVLGVPWGAPANTQTMLFMRDLLPAGATWAAFGIGSTEFPMVAQAAILGGHVRVGLEDNLYIEKGVLAPSNAALVEKAVKIVRLLGSEPASPKTAREMLGIPQSS